MHTEDVGVRTVEVPHTQSVTSVRLLSQIDGALGNQVDGTPGEF